MKEEYITAEEFSNLCQRGLTYEGYIIGVGYAFINVTFGLEYLNPTIKQVSLSNHGYLDSQYPIQKSSVCQYIDTSEEQIKKSYDGVKNLDSNTQMASSVKKTQEKAKDWHISKTGVNLMNSITQGTISYASAFSESFISSANVHINDIQNHSMRFEKRFQNGDYNRSMNKALGKTHCKINPKYTPDQRLEIARSKRLDLDIKGNVKTNGGYVSKTEFVYGKGAAKFTKVMKGAGVAGVGFQGVVSYINIRQAIDKEDERKGRIIVKSSVDFLVPIVCIVVGGHGAWIIGGTYFIVDMAGGWDSLMDHTYNLFNEE